MPHQYYDKKNNGHDQKPKGDKGLICLKCLGHELFAKEIRYNGMQFFDEKRGMFCSCFWSDLQACNNWFFLGFVISLRQIAMEDSQYIPQYYDQVFIIFLKALTASYFNIFTTYMKHIKLITNFKWYIPNVDAFIKTLATPFEQTEVKEAINELFGDDLSTLPPEVLHKMYSYHLRCANAYINLWDYYTKADRKIDKFGFEKPEFWSTDSCYANPFEGFLRDKWGVLLLSLLNISTDDVRWWRHEVKPLWNKHLEKPHICHISAAVKEQLAPLLDSAYSKNKHFITAPSIASYSCDWPPDQPKRKQLQCKEPVNFFHNLKGVDEQLWRISEELLSTPLAGRFHIPRASALMNEDLNGKYYMAVGPWFAQWTTAFGEKAFKFVQEECSKGIQVMISEVSASSKDTLNNNLLKKLKKGADILEGMRREEFAPKSDCYIKTINEFILEPFVLIQLPWNFALLNQWLALSLIEILKFELDSVELRHWPLPVGLVESCARNLLSLMCHAKECILRGLYLLAQKAMDPVGENKYPATIMDTCVLPATPALAILCNGKAFKILNSIKHHAFSESRPMNPEKVTLLPESAYTITDTRLEWFYINHAWHSFFWLDEEYKAPFPKADFDLSKKVECTIPPPRASHHLAYAAFSQQEHYFIESFFGKEWENHMTKATSDEILRTINPVLDVVFKQLLVFPKLFSAPLEVLFASKESREHILDLKYVHLSSLNSIQVAAASASLYTKLNNQLNGIDQNNSVLAWLVRLSGEVLEKEQLVRVAVACGHILDQTPALLGLLDNPAPDDLIAMQHEVNTASDQQGVRGRAWLWKQMPAKWTKPDKDAGIVFLDGKVKSRSSGVDDEMLKISNASTVALGIQNAASSIENRLGHLIVSVSKMSFKTWEAGNIAYNDWDGLHYILPYYLHALVVIQRQPDIESKAGRVQNLINFISGLVDCSKCHFDYWPLMPEERKKFVKRKSEDKNLQGLSVCNIKGRIYAERASQLMFAFVGLGRPQYYFEGVYGFQSIAEGMLQFKEPEDQQNYSKPHDFEKMAYVAYESVGMPHLYSVLKTAEDLWKPPAPDAPLKNGVLAKAYFANACLEVFEIALQCQEMYGSKALMLHPKYSDIVKINSNMVYWRCALMKCVLQCEGRIPQDLTDDQLKNFATEAQDLMCKYWILLKAVRQGIDAKMEEEVPDKLIGQNPTLKKAVKLFRQGAVFKIDDLLKLICSEKHRKDTAVDMMERWSDRMDFLISGKKDDSKSKSKVFKKPDSNNSKKVAEPKPEVLQVCRNCHKQEKHSHRYILCKQCKETDYPDKNYFCTKKCLDEWWKKEHLAEHLEYSLGIKTFD